ESTTFQLVGVHETLWAEQVPQANLLLAAKVVNALGGAIGPTAGPFAVSLAPKVKGAPVKYSDLNIPVEPLRVQIFFALGWQMKRDGFGSNELLKNNIELRAKL